MGSDKHPEIFRSSPYPWRGKYIEQIVSRSEELISRGCQETASILLKRLDRQIEQWEGDNRGLAHQHDKSLPGNGAKKVIDSLLTRLKEYCLRYREDDPVSSGDGDHLELHGVWERYRHLNELEIRKWDALCFRLMRRIKFLQQLDFSDDFKGKWGPYNRRHNIIQLLRYLNHSNPEWLENYLLLYASLQQFEHSLKVGKKNENQSP